MRNVVMALVLVACGGDPQPHVVGTCDGWKDNLGNPFPGMCEAACKKPPAGTGDTCDTTVQLNCLAFTFEEEVRGCCIPENNTIIKFVECSN